ncbi:MAG: CDC27 family protein [Bacteroidia bacterium]|nr:CDC27 family protein [Bacteroidia bacterium]
MTKKGLGLLLIGVLWAQVLPYQPAYRSLALEVLNAIYALRFSRAESLLNRLEKEFGKYVGTSYLRAVMYSWRIELDPTTTWFDSFWEAALKETDSLMRCCAKDPLEKYFIGFGHTALRVRRLYNRGEYLAAIWRARELLSLMEGVRRYANVYPELQFELGLYEYYIAFFQANYPAFRLFLKLFPPGDEARGLARLEACARDSLNYTHNEAAYFLSYICLYQAKRPSQAEYWLRVLTQRFPMNPYFRRLWAEALYELGRYAEARAVIEAWLETYETFCPRPPCHIIYSMYPTAEAIQAYSLLNMLLRAEARLPEAYAICQHTDSLLEALPTLPPPTWGRVMREIAITEKRLGQKEAAERRLSAIRARKEVPDYLKAPLP